MVFPVIPARTLDSGEFEIDNSLMVNHDLHHLGMIFGSAESSTNKKKFSCSFWCKLGNRAQMLTTNKRAIIEVTDAATATDTIGYGHPALGKFFYKQGSGNKAMSTKGEFLDPSAWYNVCIIVDTTDGTAADRCKIFVNGVRQTLMTSNGTLSADSLTQFGNSGSNVDATSPSSGNFITNINTYYNSYENDRNIDGYLADINFHSGVAGDATNFGKYNDDGIWVPIKPDLAYNAFSYRLEFKNTATSHDSSGMGADTSGSNNHFKLSTGSTLDATNIMTDSPTNNFCVINSLDVNRGAPHTTAEGNLKFTVNSALNSGNNLSRADPTIAPFRGKWYAEFKYLSGYTATDGTLEIGAISANAGRYSTNADMLHYDNGNGSVAISLDNNGRVQDKDGTDLLTGIGTFTVGDIMGVCLDLDNDKFFVSKNGSFASNGTGTQNPATGANPLYSGGFLTTHKHHGFKITVCGYGSHSSGPSVVSMNYGNSHVAISSGNADDNGYGNFEYDVPTGYYALCTKNLAEEG